MPEQAKGESLLQVLAVGPGPVESPAQASAVRALTEKLEGSGWLQVSLVSVTAHGVPALGEAASSGFDAVLLLTSLPGSLPSAQWAGLGQFLEGGGALVATQPALAGAARDSDLSGWLGACALGPVSAVFDWPVFFDGTAAAAPHPVAARARDFVVHDGLLGIEVSSAARVLATTHIDGESMPVAFSHETKHTRAIGLTLGGTAAALEHPSVHQMIERSVRSLCAPPRTKPLGVGLLGYGGTFNMGRNHVGWMQPASDLEVRAVCDTDSSRTDQARADLGDHIRTYQAMDRLFADDSVDLVVMVLPHDVHASAAIAGVQAGKHVVMEKPLSLNLAEADRMIAAATEAGVMLSCFHNHRWDGDLMRLRELVQSGAVGEVYHIDVGTAHWQMPRSWWRSSKTRSGGVLYDWGAHHVDAALSVMQRRIASVSGHLQKRYWHNMTNEDFARVMIRFVDGSTVSLEQGELAAVERPRWRVLGTAGGVSAAGDNAPLTLVQRGGGRPQRCEVEAAESDWPAYYRNVANHLLLGEPLAVTAQQARRVTGVLELAEKSSNQGGVPLALAGEDTIDPVYQAPTA